MPSIPIFTSPFFDLALGLSLFLGAYLSQRGQILFGRSISLVISGCLLFSICAFNYFLFSLTSEIFWVAFSFALSAMIAGVLSKGGSS